MRVLITHPMETGRRIDAATGQIVPAHYIEQVRIERNGKAVAHCDFGTAVSRDPYLALRLKNTQSGDQIRVSWQDNLGGRDSEEISVP